MGVVLKIFMLKQDYVKQLNSHLKTIRLIYISREYFNVYEENKLNIERFPR